MILVIRISGIPEVPVAVQETLYRLRLRRKYTATLIKENEENIKMLKKIRDFVAFGKINEETLLALVSKRGEGVRGKKFDSDLVVKELEKKGFEKVGIKGFFRLHPPRGGIDSKYHFGVKKGVLGDNKEKINDLVGRMI